MFPRRTNTPASRPDPPRPAPPRPEPQVVHPGFGFDRLMAGLTTPLRFWLLTTVPQPDPFKSFPCKACLRTRHHGQLCFSILSATIYTSCLWLHRKSAELDPPKYRIVAVRKLCDRFPNMPCMKRRLQRQRGVEPLASSQELSEILVPRINRSSTGHRAPWVG